VTRSDAERRTRRAEQSRAEETTFTVVAVAVAVSVLPLRAGERGDATAAAAGIFFFVSDVVVAVVADVTGSIDEDSSVS